ncbi:MAG TPA: nitroreductase [Lentisphaeria bacterium]|nr:MAG: nitroreductase [Lentisphaerae bacterium GWF2_50_93]HCE43651.1 nitroreductase [Lentisphaeria bacterium]
MSSSDINETLANIMARRSVRMYTDQDVSDGDIMTILSAANQAPSAHNNQSWRFVVVKGVKKGELVDLVSRRAGDFPRPSSTLLRMASRSIASSPVTIAVINTGELIRHGTELFDVDKDIAYDFFRTMEIQSSAAAVENMLIAATSLGISTVWLGILFLIKDDVLDLLGEKGEFMAVVPVGYASRQSSGPTKRPLEMIVKKVE